jgi:hypothetical protein
MFFALFSLVPLVCKAIAAEQVPSTLAATIRCTRKKMTTGPTISKMNFGHGMRCGSKRVVAAWNGLFRLPLEI